MLDIRTAQVNVPAGMIDFGIGQPGFDLLPIDIIRRAASRRLAEGDTTLLNYGYEQGDGYFRLALAGFLNLNYGRPVGAEELFVTAGASQALDLVCTLFTRPGDVVFVEEPTYFLALRIFADHGLKVISLPMDDEGLIIDALESELTRYRPALLYTVPTFQNPTGVTLSQARRERLVALGRDHGFLIVADEVYHLLNYQAVPPAPLAAYINTGAVLSIGSFSKILAPGLRLGWIQATPELIQRLVGSGLADSGGGLNHFTSNLVRVVLADGWQATHLAWLKEIYGRRVQAMQEALEAHLDGVARWVAPQGGFFFWLTLPPEVDTGGLLAAARAHEVGYQPGVKFSGRQELTRHMRLSFAFYDAADIAQGVARLAQVISGVM